MKVFSFSDLTSCDLHVDAVYQGGRSGNSRDDPLTHLLSVSNRGGFRYRGSLTSLKMVVLTSSLSDPDWPDTIDRETGIFTYYGDNKKPGVELHETGRKGNELLRIIFEQAQGSIEQRRRVPPVFIFGNTGVWRDIIFLGLAVPGTSDLRASEDLVAIWRIAGERRFQNYRARFTVLSEAFISRAWINDLITSGTTDRNAPQSWIRWIETGQRTPLLATRSIAYRTKSSQIPSDPEGLSIIRLMHDFFRDRPHAFESCAAKLAQILLPGIASLDLTRPSRDGGRDAIGQLRIGTGQASLLVDFALEAKCYAPDNAVGVREMSRLISRLRHRQFGILVTTSHVDLQAYREITEDKHPIIVISASDIVSLLMTSGYAGLNDVKTWLERDFPPIL